MHLFKQIEEKHDTRPVETSRLLGIAYTKYNAMKSGTLKTPKYYNQSAKAFMALSGREFRYLMREANREFLAREQL